jgi:sigma-B regulation protein RsbU (phosphoserine phosphatase)
LTLLLLDYRQQHDRREDATSNEGTPSNLGRVTLSGQHEEVLVVRSSGEVERIDTMDLGFPLGLEASIEMFVAERSVVLEPGDGIVLYTDGITEAENPAGEQFGLDRLQAAVSQHWQGSAQDVQNSVIAQLSQFISNATVYDDITLLILKQR